MGDVPRTPKPFIFIQISFKYNKTADVYKLTYEFVNKCELIDVKGPHDRAHNRPLIITISSGKAFNNRSTRAIRQSRMSRKPFKNRAPLLKGKEGNDMGIICN